MDRWCIIMAKFITIFFNVDKMKSSVFHWLKLRELPYLHKTMRYINFITPLLNTQYWCWCLMTEYFLLFEGKIPRIWCSIKPTRGNTVTEIDMWGKRILSRTRVHRFIIRSGNMMGPPISRESLAAVQIFQRVFYVMLYHPPNCSAAEYIYLRCQRLYQVGQLP